MMKKLKQLKKLIMIYKKNVGDNMEKLLYKICKEEKKLGRLEIQKKRIFARLWLKTDFQKELDLKKNATEKDKTSYIRDNEEYNKVCDDIVEQKALVHYLNNVLAVKLK